MNNIHSPTLPMGTNRLCQHAWFVTWNAACIKLITEVGIYFRGATLGNICSFKAISTFFSPVWSNRNIGKCPSSLEITIGGKRMWMVIQHLVVTKNGVRGYHLHMCLIEYPQVCIVCCSHFYRWVITRCWCIVNLFVARAKLVYSSCKRGQKRFVWSIL